MKYKISNSGIPVLFSGLSWDGKRLVPNGGTETGREEGWFLNAQDQEIPKFSGKKFGTQKTRPGTQTSNLWVVSTILYVHKQLVSD